MGRDGNRESFWRRWRARVVVGLLMVAAAALGAPPAGAAFNGLKPGNLFYSLHQPVALAPSPEPFEPAEYEKVTDPGALFGAPAERQAGSHADLSLGMVLRSGELEEIFEGLDTAESTEIELPQGVLADLGEFPACPLAAFERNIKWVSYEEPAPARECLADTQVGVVGALFGGELLDRTYPLYKLETEPGHLATLAFPYEILFRRVPMIINVDLRTGSDFGLDLSRANVANFNNFLPAPFMTIWGVPGAPVHNPERIEPVRWGWGAVVPPPYPPLLSSVTGCEAGPSQVRLGLGYHDSLGPVFLPGETEEPLYRAYAPEQTGCEDLPFDPSIDVRPSSGTVDSATDLQLHVHVPQGEGGLQSAPLREATISLPEGVTVDTAAAVGTAVCDAAAVGFEGASFAEPNPIHFSPEPASCPEASRVGSVVLRTPLVEEPLAGSVYLAKPTENPFGSRWAFYLVADGPGFTLKMPLELATAAGGRVTARLAGVPELPLEDIEVDLAESSFQLFSTPATCGPGEVETRLTPWALPQATPPVIVRSAVRFEPAGGGSCEPGAPKPFAPALAAKLGDAGPGASSGLTVHLAEAAGGQGLRTVDLTLPTGFVASLRGRTLCGETEIATAQARAAAGEGVAEARAPSCPAAAAVGAAAVTTGTAAAPTDLGGDLYLAGPYRGARYSLVAIMSAGAGEGEPLVDLGSIVERFALRIDPRTAQLRLESDPLPSTREGAPSRIDSLDLSFGSSHFLRNPTSCEEGDLEATVGGQQGGRVGLAAGLPLASCENLSFQPGLGLRAGSGVGPNPSLKVTLTTPSGSAGIDTAQIELPAALTLDRTRLDAACRPVGRPRSTCPSGSLVGEATAWSALLDEPLRGVIRLVAAGPGPPNLAIELDGQVALELGAGLSSRRGAAEIALTQVPDFSFERIELFLGIDGTPSFLARRAAACARPSVALTRFTAYNGNLAHRRSTLQLGCRKEE